MQKENIKIENLKFVIRAMLLHVATYILCGIVFSALFNYNELFQLGNTKYFMRSVDSSSSLIGPVFQIVRGLLFGSILLLLKENVLKEKYGWLKLWAIIVVIGIINTPGPAPFSIEGIIYTQLPIELHIKGAPEILVQTLLFSYFAAKPVKAGNRNSVWKKVPFISAVSAGILFSLSGVILALALGVDVTAGMTDIGAFMVMFAAMGAVYITCRWYGKTSFRLKHIILPLCCYVMLGVAPTVYNYLTDSVFASPLTLAINIVPVIIVFIINYLSVTRSGRNL